MDKQVIIAISREYGSGGHEIVKIISDHFKLNLYDRSILDEIAKEKDIKIEYLEKYEEKPKKTYLSRRVGAYTNSIEEIIAEMQFEFIRNKADSGESFVIVGRCAETVLKDHPGLISIFVVGDKEAKIERIQRVYNISREEAEIKRKRHDKSRKHYHNRHSDFKWGDSRNYDLCINSSKLGEEITSKSVINYIQDRIDNMK